MQITQEQFETACRDSGLFANEATLLINSLGITITPAEPPEMVKLAREIAGACRPVNEDNGTWSPEWVALAALQHAVDVVKGFSGREDFSGVCYVPLSPILTALGAGGRDAG